MNMLKVTDINFRRNFNNENIFVLEFHGGQQQNFVKFEERLNFALYQMDANFVQQSHVSTKKQQLALKNMFYAKRHPSRLSSFCNLVSLCC